MLKSLEILNNKSWELEGYKDCVINIEEFKQIKQDLELLEELIKLVMEFDVPSSVYLIGYYQAKITQRVGDNYD